jgi:hypothetical protein
MSEADKMKFEIAQLKEQLEAEKLVKKSEVQLNEDLKIQIKTRDHQIETLAKLNWDLVERFEKLRLKLQKLNDL